MNVHRVLHSMRPSVARRAQRDPIANAMAVVREMPERFDVVRDDPLAGAAATAFAAVSFPHGISPRPVLDPVAHAKLPLPSAPPALPIRVVLSTLKWSWPSPLGVRDPFHYLGRSRSKALPPSPRTYPRFRIFRSRDPLPGVRSAPLHLGDFPSRLVGMTPGARCGHHLQAGLRSEASLHHFEVGGIPPECLESNAALLSLGFSEAAHAPILPREAI